MHRYRLLGLKRAYTIRFQFLVKLTVTY